MDSGKGHWLEGPQEWNARSKYKSPPIQQDSEDLARPCEPCDANRGNYHLDRIEDRLQPATSVEDRRSLGKMLGGRGLDNERVRATKMHVKMGGDANYGLKLIYRKQHLAITFIRQYAGDYLYGLTNGVTRLLLRCMWIVSPHKPD